MPYWVPYWFYVLPVLGLSPVWILPLHRGVLNKVWEL